ncbi:MAG: dihydrodipicolinate synthase family protein, partial [Clostridia bacterium]
MKKIIFKGAGVAIATPFNQDGTVNYEQLSKLIEFQISGGTDAIVSCGTTGETSTLSEKEHVDVLDFTIKQIAKRIPVIAGTGSNDTAFSIELSKEAEKIGADGLLLITPYYNKTSQKGLIESFTKTADSVNTPVVLYNVPSRTGVNILPD